MVGLNGSALSEADINPTELNGSYTTLAAKDQQPRRARSSQTSRGPKPLLPRSLKEALQLAELLSKSKLIPKGFEIPETCLVGILYGMEVGLSPIAALQRMAVIDGRPTIWGDAALALVQASGLLQSIREEVINETKTNAEAETQSIAEIAEPASVASTAPLTQTPAALHLTAICTVRREGRSEPIIGTFSVEDARRAGLWQKPGPWTDYPKRMLTMRARAFALRDAFPDVLAGLYIREEFEGAEKRHSRYSPERSNADEEWNAQGHKKPTPEKQANDLDEVPATQNHDVLSNPSGDTHQYEVNIPTPRRAPPPPPVPSPTEEAEKPNGMVDSVSDSANALTDHGVFITPDPQVPAVVPEYDSEIIDPETLLDLLDSALCCALDLPTLEEIVDDFAERVRPLSKDHQKRAQKIIDRHQKRIEDLDRPSEAVVDTRDADDSGKAELPRGLKSLFPQLGISRMTSRMRRARRRERPSQSLASWNARHRLADHELSHVSDGDDASQFDDQAEAEE